jgi:hypothetical protein
VRSTNLHMGPLTSLHYEERSDVGGLRLLNSDDYPSLRPGIRDYSRQEFDMHVASRVIGNPLTLPALDSNPH